MKTRGTRTLRALAVLLCAVFAVAGCSSNAASQRGFQFVSPGGTTDIYYDAPDRQPVELSGESLFHKGKTISTSDFKGQVVVVNIWGSWCPPCRAEASELQEVVNKTKGEGVQVLGIAVRETGRDGPQTFMRNRGLTYPSIYDPPGRSLLPLEGYPTTVIPSTLVLDEQHRVAAIFLRPILAKDILPLVNRLTSE